MPKAQLRVFPALALLALTATAAGAVDVAGPAGPRVEIRAWAAPMAQTFVQVGLPGFQSLPQTSLQTLATRFSNKPGLKTIQDGTYDRLAENLQAAGLTPEAFKRLEPQAKVAALQKAAAASETQARAALKDALGRVPKDGRYTAQTAGELKNDLESLRDDAAYLTPAGREALARAAVEVKAFLKKRQDAFEAWLKDTPQNIRNGAFDGAGHIVKTEDGWRVGEHSPTQPAFATYADAVGARLQEIDAMRPGPWQERAMRELVGNLNDARVGAQAAAEGADVTALRAAAAAAQRRQLDPSLALARLTRAGRNAEALKQYDRLVLARDVPARGRLRRELALVDGAPEKGYPAFRDLIAARAALSQRAQRNSIRGLAVFVAGLIQTAWAAHAGLGIALPLTILTFAALGYMFVNVWQRDALSPGFDSLGTVILRDLDAKFADNAARDSEDGLRRFEGRVQTKFKPMAGVIDARYVALKDRPFVSVTVDDVRARAALPKTFEGLPVTVHLETAAIQRAAEKALFAVPGVAEVRVIHAGEPDMAVRVIVDGPQGAADAVPSVFNGLPVIVHEAGRADGERRELENRIRMRFAGVPGVAAVRWALSQQTSHFAVDFDSNAALRAAAPLLPETFEGQMVIPGLSPAGAAAERAASEARARAAFGSLPGVVGVRLVYGQQSSTVYVELADGAAEPPLPAEFEGADVLARPRLR